MHYFCTKKINKYDITRITAQNEKQVVSLQPASLKTILIHLTNNHEQIVNHNNTNAVLYIYLLP